MKYERCKEFLFKNQFVIKLYEAYHLGTWEDIEQDKVVAYYVDDEIDELVKGGQNAKALQKFKTAFRKQKKAYAVTKQRIETNEDYDNFKVVAGDFQHNLKMKFNGNNVEQNINNDIEFKELTKCLEEDEIQFLLDCEVLKRKEVIEIYDISIRDYGEIRNSLISKIRNINGVEL